MKILAMLSRVPFPLDKGDKLRAYHQLRELSRHHEIHLCCVDDDRSSPESINHLREFCQSVHVFPLTRAGILFNIAMAFFKGKPLQCGYFYSRNVFKKIQALITSLEPDHIYCQLVRVADYVSYADIPKTIDYQDVFSMGVKRRIPNAATWLKPFLWMEYKRLQKTEKYVFNLFDNKTIITTADRSLIPHPGRDQIHVIPNGVDFSKFHPVDRQKTFDLVFTGNMAYPPNIDAAVFLAREIMPEVWKTIPGCRLIIAGATPHAAVLALKNEHIHIAGWVPEMREAYASARIFIAPMRMGTGLQNKLLEAMAMKLPCITSPLAFEALGAKQDKEILLGESAADFAGAIKFLIGNPEKAIEIAEAGYIFVRRTYDWKTSTQLLEDLMQNNTYHP
jgi:sugar transferase (PEP-CTERM/EpsH1 system associated)